MIDFNEDITKVEIDARAGFKEDVTIELLKQDLETTINNIATEIKVKRLEIELPDSIQEKPLTGTIEDGELQWNT